MQLCQLGQPGVLLPAHVLPAHVVEQHGLVAVVGDAMDSTYIVTGSFLRNPSV